MALTFITCLAAGCRRGGVDTLRPASRRPILGGRGPSSISGVVLDGVGPVADVTVDLFTAGPRGGRSEWLRSTVTTDTGFRFVVEPGCYALTFIAPAGRRFGEGNTWSNVELCVDAGETRTGVDAELGSAIRGLVGGMVFTEDGGPFNGVTVDLFAAAADGGRGDYLRSQRSGAAGQQGLYGFEVDPGCYVITFLAPHDDDTFVESGTQWYNRPLCVSAGEDLDQVNATVSDPVVRSTIQGHVEQGGRKVEGVVADLFIADGTGGRGPYVTSTRTGTAGLVRFTPEFGCYVVTYTAPAGETWELTGSPWLNQSVCTAPRVTATLDTAVLAGEPDRVIRADVRVFQDGRVLGGLRVDVFEAEADGGCGRFVRGVVTGSTTRTQILIEPGDGCWVLTFAAPEGDTFSETGTPWLNRYFCSEPERTIYPFDEQLAPRPE